MEKFEKMASSGYVERVQRQGVKRAVSQERFLAVHQELIQRFTDHPWQREGDMDFLIEGADGAVPPISMSLGYDSIETPNLRQYLAGHHFNPDDFPHDMVTINMNDFRRITRLKITCDGRKFDLNEMVGDRDVFVYIGNEPYQQIIIKGNPGAFGVCSVNANVIITKFDPTSAYGLIILLHEVGHHHLEDKIYTEKEAKFIMEARVKQEMGESAHPAEMAASINDERSADAFALHIMHRLVGSHIDMKKMREIMGSVTQEY